MQGLSGRKQLFAACALLALLTLLAYWPGTAGEFIFDDELNLSSLQKYGGVHDLNTLRLFVFEGISGPTGRPLSLLSFVMDGQTWPTNPFPFKLSNILIHIINALLIFVVVLKLFQMLGNSRLRNAQSCCHLTDTHRLMLKHFDYFYSIPVRKGFHDFQKIFHPVPLLTYHYNFLVI